MALELGLLVLQGHWKWKFQHSSRIARVRHCHQGEGHHKGQHQCPFGSRVKKHALKPFVWQSTILVHLLKLLSKLTTQYCQPTFLCQPTGGGKFMVQDSYVASVGGVTLNIAPLLALNADQHTKLSEKQRSWQIMSVTLGCLLQSLPIECYCSLISS